MMQQTQIASVDNSGPLEYIKIKCSKQALQYIILIIRINTTQAGFIL